MKRLAGIVVITLVTLAPASGFFALSGCNGSAGGGPVDVSDYFLQTYVIRDMERGFSARRVSLKAKGAAVPNAEVSFDSVMVPYVPAGEIYQKEFNSVDSIQPGVSVLRISSGGEQILQQDVIVPDTFTAQVVSPFNKLYTGGQQVQVGLATGSVNAQGYIVAVIPKGEEYKGKGYAQFVDLVSPSGIIPPDVFRDTLNPNILLEGVWYVYMYAYTGAPQIDGWVNDLPTALPDSGFTANLNLSKISGTYGSIVVSKRDTLVVTNTP